MFGCVSHWYVPFLICTDYMNYIQLILLQRMIFEYFIVNHFEAATLKNLENMDSSIFDWLYTYSYLRNRSNVLSNYIEKQTYNQYW